MSDTTPPSPPITAAAAPLGALGVSIYALTLFLAAIVVAWYKANDTLLTALLGVAATNATTVINFWVGSSRSSQKKDDTIANIQGTKP